jgi:OOP family OmpA-OmpF porin
MRPARLASRQTESDTDMLRKGLAAGVLLLSAMGAHADERRGFEAGLGISRADFEVDNVLKDHELSYSAFVGYRFIPQLAVEAHYFKTGKAGWVGQNASLEIGGRAYGVSALGQLPIGEYFAVTARAGYLRGELDADSRFNNLLIRETLEESSPFYGVGVRTMLDNSEIRLEYLRTDFDVVEIDLVQLSVAWLF